MCVLRGVAAPPTSPVCPTAGGLWQQGEGLRAPRRAPVRVGLRGHLPGDTHPGTVWEGEQGTLTCQATTMACIDSQIPAWLKVGCLFSSPIPRFVAFLGWALQLSFPRCSWCRGHPSAPIAQGLSSAARSHSTSVLARAKGSSWGSLLAHPGLPPLLRGVKTRCRAPGVPTLTVRWVAPTTAHPGGAFLVLSRCHLSGMCRGRGRVPAPSMGKDAGPDHSVSSPPAHPARVGTEQAANCWGNQGAPSVNDKNPDPSPPGACWLPAGDGPGTRSLHRLGQASIPPPSRDFWGAVAAEGTSVPQPEPGLRRGQLEHFAKDFRAALASIQSRLKREHFEILLDEENSTGSPPPEKVWDG